MSCPEKLCGTEHLTFPEALVQKTEMAAGVDKLEISNKNQFAVRIGVPKSTL